MSFGENNKNILWVIIFTLIVVLGGSIGKGVAKAVAERKEEAHVRESIIDLAKDLNRQVPIMIDSDTRLDAVVAAQKNLLYKYTLINVSENEIDKKLFESFARNQIINTQTPKEDFIKALDMGIEFNYMYFDKDGKLISKIIINKQTSELFQ